MQDDILLVDDDPGAIQLMGRILASVGNLRFATNGIDALRLAQESTPDLILLDAEMQGMSGFAVLDALKVRPEMADVPIIFVTSHSEPAFEVSALEAGAADFIAKPIRGPLVLARVATQLRLKRMTNQLRVAAATDSLTGIANRRAFDVSLEHEWQRGRRGGDPISLLMIDVDHFKQYNDLYGHPKGDKALQRVAKALTACAQRTGDFVARCGGEEFALLLPQTPRLGAEHVARRVLEAVDALNIAHPEAAGGHLTVSVGIGCYAQEDPYWIRTSDQGRAAAADRRLPCASADLVLTADEALYSAKRGGRAQFRLKDVPQDAAPFAGGHDPFPGGLQRAG